MSTLLFGRCLGTDVHQLGIAWQACAVSSECGEQVKLRQRQTVLTGPVVGRPHVLHQMINYKGVACATSIPSVFESLSLCCPHCLFPLGLLGQPGIFQCGCRFATVTISFGYDCVMMALDCWQAAALCAEAFCACRPRVL